MGKSYTAYHDVFVNMKPFPSNECLGDYFNRKGFKIIPTFVFASAEELDDLDNFDYHPPIPEPQKKRRKSVQGKTFSFFKFSFLSKKFVYWENGLVNKGVDRRGR